MDLPEDTRKGFNRYEISNGIEDPGFIFTNGAIQPVVDFLNVQRLRELFSRK